jgi:hypothetical protein
MRAPLHALLAATVCAAAAFAAPAPAHALYCGVFGRHPCVYHPFHQVCSVFSRRPCVPQLQYPFGEQLQLTIESRDREPDADDDRVAADREGPEELGTLGAVFAALRSCWIPPAKADSRPGAQFAVRVSFKRNGEIFGKPRITYVTPGLPGEVRQAYWDAIEAAIERCTPLAFTDRLGGALAGRPFAVRFVDRRAAS